MRAASQLALSSLRRRIPADVGLWTHPDRPWTDRACGRTHRRVCALAAVRAASRRYSFLQREHAHLYPDRFLDRAEHRALGAVFAIRQALKNLSGVIGKSRMRLPVAW